MKNNKWRRKTVKRIVSFVLAFVMIFGAAPLSGFVGIELPEFLKVFAEGSNEFNNGTFTYKITSYGYPTVITVATIVDISPNVKGHVVIPATLDGVKVTMLDLREERAGITSITIPQYMDAVRYRYYDNNYDGSYWQGISYLPSLEAINVDANNTIFRSVDGVLFKDYIDHNDNPVTRLCIYPEGKKDLSYQIPEGVTEIGEAAFGNCQNLQKVIMPDTVTNIENYTFAYSKNLMSVKISNSLPFIHPFCFEHCESLQSIEIPDSVVNIGDDAFAYCTKLSDVKFGNGLIWTSSGAFRNCTSLKVINFPDSLELIRTRARLQNMNQDLSIGCFEGCTSLETVYLGKKIEEIDDNTFKGCTNLKTVRNDGEALETIGVMAFYDCHLLENVELGSNIKYIKNAAFENCEKLTKLTSKEKSTNNNTAADGYIGTLAFGNCKSLKHFKMHDNIAEIGFQSFVGSGIESVSFSKSLKKIDDEAFYGCNLGKLALPESLEEIGYNAFYECKKLTDVVTGNNIKLVGEKAFYRCSSLSNLKIGGAEKIGVNAFAECTNLSKAVLESNVEEIGESAFYNCDSLANIVTPDSIRIIGDRAFYDCDGLQKVTLGSGLESIGNSAFSYNESLKEIIIPDNVKNIGQEAFYACRNLSKATLGNKVESIGDRAFSDCALKGTFAVPDSTKHIGSYALEGNNSLESITVGKSLETIGEKALSTNNDGYGSYCSLNSIKVSPENKYFMDDGGVLYDINQTYLIKYPSGKPGETFEFPASVKKMDSSACEYTQLKNVTLSNRLTEIPDNAFRSSKLESITIPDSVKRIGDGAFRGNNFFKQVDLGSGVTSIGSDAFNNSAINKLVIPDNVKEIGIRCFYSNKIVDLTLNNTMREIPESAFSYNKIKNIVIPENIEQIGESAFQSHDDAEITIPKSVTYIGKYAFLGDNLKSINVASENKNYSSEDGVLFNKDKTEFILYPGMKSGNTYYVPCSVKTIKERAFPNNHSLRSLIVLGNVGKVEDYAFDGLKNNRGFAIYGNTGTYIEKYAEKENIPFRVMGSDSFTLTPKYSFLNVGDKLQLQTLVYGKPTSDVKYSTLDDDIISVSPTGEVTALADGIASVHVKSTVDSSYNFCIIYVGAPNKFENTIKYDKKQLYVKGTGSSDKNFPTSDGFYSEVSSFSDCIEIFCKFENNIDYSLQTIMPEKEFNEAVKNFKSIKPITITAKVSGNDLSFSRTEYQNTYTATYDSILPGKSVPELLMLFPYKFTMDSDKVKSYTVEITVSSESFDTFTREVKFEVEDLVDKPARDCIKYLDKNADYKVLKKNIYGETMADLKNEPDYVWTKITSLNFKNYHQVVLADILVNVLAAKEATTQCVVADAISNWANIYIPLYTSVTTVLKDSYEEDLRLTETSVDKWMKISKYGEDDSYQDGFMYNIIMKKFGTVSNAGAINKIFSKIDLTNKVVGAADLTINTVFDIMDWTDRISAYNAINKADDDYKEIIKAFANKIPTDTKNQRQMKEAVEDYINFTSSSAGSVTEVLESLGELAGGLSLEGLKYAIGQSNTTFLCDKITDWLAICPVKINGAWTTFATTGAYTTVASALGGVAAGVSIGICISELIADNSGRSEEMCMTVAAAEFSPYIVQVLNDYETGLRNSKDLKALNKFEYAFKLHKSAQSFIIDHTVKSLQKNADTAVVKFYNRLFNKDDYASIIKDTLAYKEVVDNITVMPPLDKANTVSDRIKVVEIKCPTDVCIYDYIGKAVVRIVDGRVVTCLPGYNAVVWNNQKFISLPATEQYKIEITATGSGTMDYAVNDYTDGAKRVHTVEINNIPLEPNREFEGEITDEINANPEEYDLYYEYKPVQSDTVVKTPVESIEIDIHEKELAAGESFNISATVKPFLATNKKVIWKSDNPNVATVDENGVVTAVASGKATISAVTEEWGYMDTCVITVEGNEGIKGDVNSDGAVNVIDARRVMMAVSGNLILSDEERRRADINADGKVDVIDARWLMQIASGNRES